MDYLQLGRSDMRVSRICFGTWAFGGWWWGKSDDDESIEAIHAALDAGINFFDTADIYGGGRSESVVARGLEGQSDVYIATKGAVLFDDKWMTGVSNEKAYLKRACEASLKRLKREVIDLYQIHWPDNKTPVSEPMEALMELQKEGKIRYGGLSNFGIRDLEVALDTARYESIQPLYNLLHREIEAEVLPFCDENEIGVLAYSPLASGLLTGKFDSQSQFPEGDHRRDHPDFTEEAFQRNLRIIDQLKEFAEKRECTVTQLSVSWVLAQPGLTCAICGARNAMQLDEIVEAVDYPLSQAEVDRINHIASSTE
ncbi:MAG: aldo/keto reductase [Candidatus Omnitrophica bacterium]|nr:MAG: General stress protein 69 [Candidatus Hinthialibacteria bacterium OLB16]MBE7489414.1 aldo/keto reductase [bacterium]MBW7938267.1 aldo/keto reductase [Candidatus Omnitrophota bacterium]MCE7908425.1 aldo/keto reductase [Candidatus Omnitrophica bacterium COP1]MBV6483438.1 Aldo-keto reductase YhdN [bacterium]